MKNRTSAAAFCIALLAPPAMAQPQSPPQPHADPPGAPGGGGGRLTQLFVSPCGEPFRAGATAPYPVAAWFTKADANHDGVLDRAEFRADADAFFDTLDLNRDGVVSGFELSRYEHLVVPEILSGRDLGELDRRPRIILAQMDDMGGMGGMGGGAVGAMGGGPGRGGPSSDDDKPSGWGDKAPPSMEGAAAFDLLAEPEPVAGADMDFDGRITRAEFQDAADRRFRRLDVKGDGKLTLAALPPTVQQQTLGGRRRGPS
jgi:hypothetical protein